MLSGVSPSERIQLLCAIALIVLTGLVPDLVGSKYWSHNFQLVNIIIAAAVFQNFLMHDANQISFGQGAIFGLGAYVAAMATALAGLSWVAAVGVAAVSTAAAGLLFALPALRVQGYYLGFVTLSAAMVFPELLFVLDRYTNGINGISVPAGFWRQPLVLGITPLSFASAGVGCLALIFHLLVRHSAFGRKVRVAGASPEAAQTLGIRPGLMRSTVFILASLGTGVAGSLYTPIIEFVTPAAFHLELSILLFLAVIVGGRGEMLGPLTGIYLLYLLPNVLLVELIDYRLLAYGVLALGVMLAMPDGIIGTIHRRIRRHAIAGGTGLLSASLELPGAQPACSTTKGPAATEISVRGVTKTFGAVVALDKVDLDIPRRMIVGLVGGNGSGKTTLLNTITGFNKPSRGTITIRGEDVRRMSPARIARLGIGRTFQTPRVFDALTAWENIEIGNECSLSRHQQASVAALEPLRRKLSRSGTEAISHGQRRSMEVLRVLLTGAEVLLLDEPAAGLSSEERQALSDLLVRLRDQHGKTILLVEHDLDLVWRIADRIVVIEGGRIVANGPPRDLVGNAAVKKLFVHTIDA